MRVVAAFACADFRPKLRRFEIGGFLTALLLITSLGLSWAADVIVKDGDTLVVDGTTFRLDGIDAPELDRCAARKRGGPCVDQVCLDEKSSEWPCGSEARNRLATLTDKRAVRCDDQGPDLAYPGSGRRIGICWVEGDDVSLNQRLVREGWALRFQPYAKRRFKQDEADAQANRRGLWKGCFSTPRDFRRWNKQAAKLLGPTCLERGKDTEARNVLFPDNTAPPGCSIKGKMSSRAGPGYVGIYHVEGCSSYRITKTPDRWFCSEDEARAAGFRKEKRC